MHAEKAGKSAAELRYRGVDIRGARSGDGLVARLERVERRADAADIRRAAKTEDLLDHGVHVALPGAHLVNDVAAGVLNVARGENAAAADKGADDTKNYVSKFGRARSYGEQTLGTPDAGAVSMKSFFAGLAKDDAQ